MVGYSQGRKRRRNAAGNAPTENEASQDSPATPAPAADSSTITVAEPMDVLIRRYQSWKKNGAPHEENCFVCGKPNYLLYCSTCKRAYHEACLEREPTSFFFREQFFCSVCITREWHQKPPPLSPTQSPPSETQNQRPETQRAALPNQRQRISILNAAPESTAMASPVSRSSQDQSTILPPLLPSHSAGGEMHSPLVRLTQVIPARSTSTALAAASHSAAAARSRFSTLSPDVDQAVSVLLRELEYLGAEREKTKQLESTITMLQQDIRIQDNALKLAQRSAEMERQKNQRSVVLENERLMQDVRDLRRTLDEEKERAAAYQREMLEARAETATAKTELDALRGKLRGLLGA